MTARDLQPHLVRGLVAGVAGTSVMTAYQLVVQRIERSRAQGDDTEPPTSPDSTDWSDAAAPAQVAVLAIGRVTRRPVRRRHEGLLTTVMHWGYGTTWGIAYAVAAGVAGRPSPIRGGATLCAAVLASDYTVLPALGVYRPAWRYPLATLTLDLSHHLVYGVGVAGTEAALVRRGGRPVGRRS